MIIFSGISKVRILLWQRYLAYYRAYSKSIAWPLLISQRRAPLKNTAVTMFRYLARGTVLDVGTGPGTLPAILAESAPWVMVIGIDLEPVLLRDAQRRTAANKSHDRVSFLQADVHALPFANEKFDMVVSVVSFHQWRNPQAAVNELFRVLKVQGLMVIEVGRRRIYPGRFALLDFITKKSAKYIFTICKTAGFKEINLENPDINVLRVVATK
jgi:ubiquinone/menaquinone biosynthesis C-methylase UbiE